MTSLTTREAFGPFCFYHLSRGLTLDIRGKEAYLQGGSHLYKAYEIFPESDDLSIPFDEVTYDNLVRKIEKEVGVRVVAYASKLNKESVEFKPYISATDYNFNRVLPPEQSIFRLHNLYISAEGLAEEILIKLQMLEFYCCIIIFNQVDDYLISQSNEICANLKEQIFNGNLDSEELDILVKAAKNAGLPIEQAFFLSNASSLADDMRNTLMRACYHFSSMTKNLWLVNQNVVVDDFSNDNIKQVVRKREIIYSSGLAIQSSHEFTSSVIACYSTLELLYELFVYLIKEPFGIPNYPKGLKFPDEDPSKAFPQRTNVLLNDLSSLDAPFAIPNLSKKKFTSLRRLRNDLLHNMASDEIRARLFVGIGNPPVNNHELQYVHYLTRDIETNGNPIQHPLSRRFYKQQVDAQHILHDWLIDTSQCVFDTVDWLIHRLKNKAKDAGLINEN
ncbi:hypothetical protein RIVM261_076130 [Rivularia sp. IAM M-261]|nr:hypothetical protein RIVM261_076130 [Rivularia sp. IAM M-261]